jgi:hypothetical protein
MKGLSEQQYERVARWLDGERIDLSAQEMAAGGEIRRGEASLVAALGVEMPPQVLRRVQKRIVAELARPAHRPVRIGFVTATAAAAALLLAAGLFRMAQDPGRAHSRVAEVTVSVLELMQALGSPYKDAEMDMLAGQMAELEADVLASRNPSSLDLEIDALQQEIDDFILEDASFQWPTESSAPGAAG